MPFEFKLTRRVEFADTDMAGIMHFSNFFRFMEATEAAFYRSLGLSVVMARHDPPIGWPRVHAECDYQKPLRFEDVVEVHLLVREKRTRSMSLVFRFNKTTEQGSEAAARGLVTIVCATQTPDGKLVSVAIPKAFSDQIQVAPAELLG